MAIFRQELPIFHAKMAKFGNPFPLPPGTLRRSSPGEHMKRLFTAHPASVGESYVEHMGAAFSFALPMLAAGLACAVHGLLPFAFTTTGSRTIRRLHDRMVVNRVKPGRVPAAAAE
jgi:hypothetical protein